MSRSTLIAIVLVVVLLILLLLGLRCTRRGGAAENQNLLVNGDAEAGPGTPDGTKVAAAPGWKTTGLFNVVAYGAASGYPVATVPGPADRGKNFFAGGPDGDVSTATQVVDVSGLAQAIDTGTRVAVLSGYLGGFEGQNDNARVAAEFQNAAGAKLGSATIGPVTPADRNSITSFLLRTARVPLPSGTRRIAVTMTMTRYDGRSNDGYADDLSLMVTAAP